MTTPIQTHNYTPTNSLPDQNTIWATIWWATKNTKYGQQTILRWAIIIGEWTHLPIWTVLNLKRLLGVKLIDGASNLECSDRAKFIRIIQQAGCCHGHDFELWNRVLFRTKPGHVPTFQPLMYKKYFGQDIPWAYFHLHYHFYFHLGIYWVMGVKIHRTTFIILWATFSYLVVLWRFK